MGSPAASAEVLEWYEDFQPVADGEVRRLLEAADLRVSVHATKDDLRARGGDTRILFAIDDSRFPQAAIQST